MTLGFTLAGAYFPISEPFEAKRLDVEIRIVLRKVRLAPFEAVLTGAVRADGLAEAAAASGTLRGSRANLEYALDFVTDDCRPAALSFSQSFATVTVRSLTELTGRITEQNTGTVLGRVRLRLDVRRSLGL